MNVSTHINKCALVSCAFLLIGLPAISNAQGSFDEVFIFGDSISDAGNIYELTGETSKAPYALIPTWPYSIGGHHYSNGKTWAERLAQNLNDPGGGKASLQSPGKNGNRTALRKCGCMLGITEAHRRTRCMSFSSVETTSGMP
jgi:phospholipase/lecithinase/hemolysin